jgi:hypothetical protein
LVGSQIETAAGSGYVHAWSEPPSFKLIDHVILAFEANFGRIAIDVSKKQDLGGSARHNRAVCRILVT